VKEEVSQYLDEVALQQADAQAPAAAAMHRTAKAATHSGSKRKDESSQQEQGTAPTAILLSALKRAEVRWFKGSLQVVSAAFS
jgi:hypothetical protein